MKKKLISIQESFNIEMIRTQIADVAHNLNWLQKTGKLFAPNIPDFDCFWKPYLELLELAKVDLQGKIRKKDKRGYWR